MADDKLNEGSEEENKSNQSDEDFGLPDLEFDELQELDFNLDDAGDEAGEAPAESEESTLPEPEGIDMSVLDDIDVPESTEPSGLQPGDLDPPEGNVLDEGIEEVEDVLDSAQLISDRLGDDEEDPLSPDFSADINYDDLIGGHPAPATEESFPTDDLDLGLPTDDTNDTDDLLANIDSPDQLAALGILDEEESVDAPTESESAFSSDFGDDDGGSSLFAVDDAGSDDGGSIFATDSVDIDEEKPEFEEPDTPTLPPNYKPYSYEESSGGFAKVIIIGVLIITIIGGVFYYFSSSSGSDEPLAKKETPKKRVKKTPVVKKKTEETTPVESTPKEAKPVEKKEEVNTVTPAPQVASANPGEIVRVKERTSRSYVIIGSFIDEDLAMDYATQLSGEGNGVKIIHPYGKSKRYRVSIADYASYGDAASQLNSFKGQYGSEVWALQY